MRGRERDLRSKSMRKAKPYECFSEERSISMPARSGIARKEQAMREVEKICGANP